MGGLRSGKRREHSGKELTSDYARLDIRSWTQQGLLYRGSEFNVPSDPFRMGLSFRIKVYLYYLVATDLEDSPTSKRSKTVIEIDRTECNFGGTRAWFRCPNVECNRRVAVLFIADKIVYRKCADLRYASQYRSALDRNLHIYQMIRLRLGGSGSLMEPFPEKPKGTRWSQYLRLWKRASKAESASWSAMAGEVSRLERRLLPSR